MLPAAELIYDAAWALNIGRRDQQEDAIAADFPLGQGHGFAVLADGMGGHAAGDVASKIVVTEIFAELKMLADDPVALERNIRQTLRDAVTSANYCVEQFVSQNPAASGMGATLVAPVIFEDRLYWVSVGDSPLFLFRDGKLSQINENHSMAAQIDLACSQGLIDKEEADAHPDRQCLTSALAGHEIPQIDCSGTPVTLRPGDIVLAASDGLQFLTDDQIEQVLADLNDRPSAEISAAFFAQLKQLGHPDQDNVSLCVIKIAGSEYLGERTAKPLQNATPVRQENDAQKVKSLTVLVRKNDPNTDKIYCISQKERA